LSNSESVNPSASLQGKRRKTTVRKPSKESVIPLNLLLDERLAANGFSKSMR